LLDRAKAVRIQRNSEHLAFIKAADHANHLTFCQRALDILGSIAWVINYKILKIAIHFWNNNIDISGLPSLYEPIKINPPPNDAPYAVKLSYRKKCREQDNLVNNNYSQRCSVVYKLDISRAVI
jgi:DNA-directed RNA polymerase